MRARRLTAEAVIRAGYRQLCAHTGIDDVAVAVRSSATAEDQPDASFAGQQDTYLWIRGADDVVNHVVRCWASLYTDRAISYRHENGYPHSDVAMSVAVQQMVLPKAAGVAFTLNPTNGDRSTIVIDSAFGLGESVVSGTVTPDNYMIDKVIFEITKRTVSAKELECCVEGGRVVQRSLDADRSTSPSLTDDEIRAIAKLARQAEKHFGRPQDVEWAVTIADDGSADRSPAAEPSGDGVEQQAAPGEPRGAHRGRRGRQQPAEARTSQELASPSAHHIGGTAMSKDRFDSPFSVTTPPGAEGWEDLYHYHLLFSEARKSYDESVFWFRDAIHLPTVMPPFDASLVEYAFASLGSYNSRHYIVPPAMGIDIRILNGYFYLSPVPVADPSEIPGSRRALHAARRALLRQLGRDRSRVDRQGQGRDRQARGVELRAAARHGRSRRRHRPCRPQQRLRPAARVPPIGRSVAGAVAVALRDAEPRLRRVPRLLRVLQAGVPEHPRPVDRQDGRRHRRRPVPSRRGVAPPRPARGRDAGSATCLCEGTVDQALAAVESAAGGKAWLAEYATAQYPWFNYSNGTGFYHTDAVWAERLDIPFSFMRGYIRKLQAGEEIDTPQEAVIAERDRVASEYIDLLDGDDKANFEAKLGLSRTVFHYVENHNFYVEHWGISVMWRKMRELSNVFIKEGFWDDADDIFMLKRDEIPTAISDMTFAWAAGVAPRGPSYWPDVVAKRRAIMAACQAWDAPPALGAPPDVVTEPFTIMLWGITSDSIQKWLGGVSDDGGLSGFAASPGVVEGIARVSDQRRAGLGDPGRRDPGRARSPRRRGPRSSDGSRRRSPTPAG